MVDGEEGHPQVAGEVRPVVQLEEAEQEAELEAQQEEEALQLEHWEVQARSGVS